MIVQASNNADVGWSGPGYIAFGISFLLFVKDLALLVVFFTQRCFDGLDVWLRPGMRETIDGRRIERDVYFNLRGYLQDPDAQPLDEEGNTSLHQATRLEDPAELESQLAKNPHLLFMLNREGLTPLDVAVMEGNSARAELLIARMGKFHSLSSIRFVNKPNRLEQKFEKPFTLVVYTNNLHLMSQFPEKGVRTSFVSMSQTKDYAKYKYEKNRDAAPDQATTALHLACRLSNYEAVRVLLDRYRYDVNVLQDERSAVYSLLSTSNHTDCNVLNFMMKRF